MKRGELKTMKVTKLITFFSFIMVAILLVVSAVLNKEIDKGVLLAAIIMLFAHLDSRQKYTKQLKLK